MTTQEHNRLLKIGEAADFLKVSTSTLRRWEKSHFLVPTRVSPGGTRYYSEKDLERFVQPRIPAPSEADNTT